MNTMKEQGKREKSVVVCVSEIIFYNINLFPNISRMSMKDMRNKNARFVIRILLTFCTAQKVLPEESCWELNEINMK